MTYRALVLVLGLAGCVRSPDLVAQLGDDESGDLTETGQPPDAAPPESGCVGDCPCPGGFCSQSCPADFQSFCDMECPPAAICTQTCESSTCSSDCFEGSSCYEQCLTGECTMGCHGGFECGLECIGGTSCSMLCQDTDDCHMSCPNGNCTMLCIGSVCTLEECPSGCTIFCSGDSMCSANCLDSMACAIEYF